MQRVLGFSTCSYSWIAQSFNRFHPRCIQPTCFRSKVTKLCPKRPRSSLLSDNNATKYPQKAIYLTAQVKLPQISEVQNATFDQCLPLARNICFRLQEEPQDENAYQVLKELLSREEGARAFFVEYLSDYELSLPDKKPPFKLEKLLKDCDEYVPNLLARNLAMSVAKEVDLANDSKNAENEEVDDTGSGSWSDSVEESSGGPTMVKERTALLIDSIASSEIARELVALWFSIRSRKGKYVHFLERQKFRKDQLDVIQRTLEVFIGA
ncbi:hypothetical protein Gasu2_21970 [Galdieria sulphuraria]|uniref:Uncharacterized protein n=1 Tax=Galdieria sulphuraria TaxID=130081 RepID=M2X7Y4_GALSU|nr:uncharacterized protein Gasu_00370 [Galdieria sulphuraria]EME32665.1 hypothetical protein Gasu_00370 [Galdieria sulphuraria]GJD07868.1 hypothetical protein Gasu2_21970 [Galdieria sulphuraria]|eukprot:XP_005709185.1 hypothetical protein Gasu_00370 [Galdieria sulphuraria]